MIDENFDDYLTDYYEEDDTEDYDENEEECDWEDCCVECGKPSTDECCCCGLPMCYMCWELQAGFCSNCPTEEWVQEREAELEEVEDDTNV